MMADESSVVRVWLEPWQWGCCGDEFGVGDTVSWRLGPAGDRYDDQFSLGLDRALAPDYFEDHHIDLPEDAPLTTGVVRRIRRLLCAYGRVGGKHSYEYAPVAGTVEVSDAQRLERGVEFPEPLQSFGYLIDLEIPGPKGTPA
ncbi:DUF6578 domain-containing protein [Leucobacter chromiiresistens]|uniref:DUF6578 domain-containing protein n=1 Tax=Leucobacter chromiiresistens TaxID=1079994 RepID=UPI000AFD280C|nr:DUF6578 domain-containing protein [Leucobacter chromiiresistens]